MTDEQQRYWSYRLVDLGDDATGNHRGVAICEVHFEGAAPKSYSPPVHVESFRDHFGVGATAEHCRQAIITTLERMIDAARSFPVLLASEIADEYPAGEAADDRFSKLVKRIAAWTDDELEAVSAAQTRHIAQVVLAGADPEYPPFAHLRPVPTA